MRLVLFDTENKELSWKERKDATLQNLENCDRKCAMLICADKLSNIRDMLAPDPWKCFFFEHSYIEKCEEMLTPYINRTAVVEKKEIVP